MEFDIQAARAYRRRRALKRRAHLSRLVQTAQEEAKAIIAMLIEQHRPERIYQWGSLLRPERFREWSDIDIAVEGLVGPLDGLHAAEQAEAMTSFPVDLVELDRIDPRHAHTIRTEGVVVYERFSRRALTIGPAAGADGKGGTAR